jgi:hypothetical protein
MLTWFSVIMGSIVEAGRRWQVQNLINAGAIRQQIAVRQFIDGAFQSVRIRDAQELADTILRIKRDASFIGHDGQKDIQEGFRMAQAFEEALTDETMFDPSETAVTTTDAIGTQDGDIGSHDPKAMAGGCNSPSRFVYLTGRWPTLTLGETPT